MKARNNLNPVELGSQKLEIPTATEPVANPYSELSDGEQEVDSEWSSRCVEAAEKCTTVRQYIEALVGDRYKLSAAFKSHNLRKFWNQPLTTKQGQDIKARFDEMYPKSGNGHGVLNKIGRKIMGLRYEDE